jgi:hypothetical protein
VACGANTSAVPGMTRERIEGLTKVKKKPASGWRDGVALLGTAFGIFGAGVAGVLALGPAGLLLGPAFGVFGYTKQYWRTALRRTPRLAAMAAPARPEGEALVGIARPFEKTIDAQVLARATTIHLGPGVMVRGISSVPFWLALEHKRVLVTGEVWLASLVPEELRSATDALRELEVNDLPVSRAQRRKLRASRVTIEVGDRVSVIGNVREEQLPGGGGYRDSLAETVRGEAGQVVWIQRL